MKESGEIFVESMHESQEISVRRWSFSELPERIAIGRSSNNDVVLAESVVSRWHAEVVRIGTGWMFEILGMNGAYIDGQRVDSFPLWDGACVQLGQTGPRLRFMGTALRSGWGTMPQLPKPCETQVETNVSSDLLIQELNWRTEEPEPLVSRAQAAIFTGPRCN